LQPAAAAASQPRSLAIRHPAHPARHCHHAVTRITNSKRSLAQDMPAASAPTTAAPSATAHLHAIGGSLGSALALLLFYPLERARIELQSRAADATSTSTQHGEDSGPESDRRKNDNGGILSCLVDLHERGELYRGATPVVTTLGISNYVFFYALNTVKRILAARGEGSTYNSKAKSLLASSLAGVINVLLTNPLWVANLRIVKGMKSQRRKIPAGDQQMHWQQQQQEQHCSAEMNLFSMMRTIAKEEGVGHLWSGTWASILLVSNPVIQFFLYEQIKSALLRRRQDQRRLRRLSSSAVPPSLDTLSPIDAFVVGAVAKTIATIATYPVQLAQTVLRLQEKRSPPGSTADGKEYDEEVQDNAVDGDKDTLCCLVRIYQEDGVAGIYQGMNAKLLQTVLTASFMFIGYEKILEFAALITK